MTININLSGMDLAAAGKEGVTALVNACAAFAGASLGTEIEMPDKRHKVTTGNGIVVPEKVYVDEPIPVKPEHVAPAIPAPPSAPPTPVPTADAPTYTLEVLQLACAPLMDANRMAELQATLVKYGAQDLTKVDPAQYGALAADLRALGARL